MLEQNTIKIILCLWKMLPSLEVTINTPFSGNFQRLPLKGTPKITELFILANWRGSIEQMDKQKILGYSEQTHISKVDLFALHKPTLWQIK